MKPEWFIFIGCLMALIEATLFAIAITLSNIHALLKERVKGD